ncbi:unnamed protein product [Rhizoctonia solani]|uniref:Uncharacterized protein n=2 Tax=Rhizoctonia solani TaxID=456999 RepID=A0A8H2XN92_9AGAM|nr:unnamed protein product [Rhizoctonia solani]CAE6510278.1 unnamed protein product [Rhizoctonia solani]
MNSSTEAYMTGSFQTSRDMGSASRSNSTASYPDYAPPAYEVVVSMTLPETDPESGILEAMVSEKPDTTTTVQEVESVMSHNPIDPPPHCFNRTPTFDTPPKPLTQPFVVQGNPGKKFLDDAFEIIGTSALEMYDVLSHDWVRMLEDIRLAARLTKGQKRTSQVLPLTMYMGCTGFFASRAIEKRMKKKNSASVVELLDIWNERFFKPRGIKIMLCRKDWQVSGTSACGHVQLPAPDRPNARSRQKDYCGARKWERYANGHTDERFDGLSKCARRRERCEEREANRGQQRQSCPSGREGYRLVVVSI